MARRRKGRRGSSSPIARLLALPFVALGWTARRLLAIPVVRRALALLTAALLLLAAEAIGLALLFGTRHRTRLGAAIVAAYALSLWLIAYAWWKLRRRRRLRLRRFESLLALTPSQFEAAVGDLLRDQGFRDMKHVGRAGDLAADLRCRDGKGRSVVVQCKRYAPGVRVGSADVQAFIGMVTVHHQAERGIFVTTSEFTAPAARLAREHGIELIDGRRLTRLVEGP
jgi:restriction system protein